MKYEEWLAQRKFLENESSPTSVNTKSADDLSSPDNNSFEFTSEQLNALKGLHKSRKKQLNNGLIAALVVVISLVVLLWLFFTQKNSLETTTTFPERQGYQQKKPNNASSKGGIAWLDPMTESSVIKRVGYNFEKDSLYIEFVNSGDIYEYFDVSFEICRGIVFADSPGQYFHENIKGVYAYKKLT